MGLTRVAINSTNTLSHTFYVDETATDPTGTPTYAIVDANGTSVQSGNATVVGSSSGRITAVLTSQAAMKRLTVTWTATVSAVTVVETDYVEVVGGFFFTLAQGRASDASLADTSKYPTADIIAKRLEVEVECETICDRSFVPRYERVVLDGTGTSALILKMNDPTRSIADIRSIRSVKVAPQLDETFVAYTAAELAALSPQADGTLVRTDGGIFTGGLRNVVVEFEYGLDSPPADLVTAATTRLRSRLNFNKNGIPDRAASYSLGEHGVYRITMPGTFETGLPEVDSVYSRYSRRSTDKHKVPASRSLNYNPQYHSLFHGGVR